MMRAKKELPSFVKKRKLLYSDKISDERRLQAGRAFMDEGRYDDALEFFSRCGEKESVRDIADRASRNLNVPVFLRASVILGKEPDSEVLKEMGDRSVEKGRISMAALAYQKAGFEEKAAEIRDVMPGGEPEEEQEKESDEGVK